VADELERGWNEVLVEVEELKSRVAEHGPTTPKQSDENLDAFSHLAKDIEEIWNSNGCNEKLKKQVIRSLIREIVVDLDESAGEINLVIHWQGGDHTGKALSPLRGWGHGLAGDMAPRGGREGPQGR